MENIHSFYRPRVMKIYNTLNHFRNIGIPVEPAFWDAISVAYARIQNGLDYDISVMRGTSGLHATLSMSSFYNPYQTAYDQIVSDNLIGWENRVNLPNAYSGTSYYMFKIQDDFYLVWVNAHGEINELCDDYWVNEISVVSVSSSQEQTEAAASESEVSLAGDTGGTLYPLPPTLYHS